ncbi:MAG: hypothetical protein U1E56_09240 [Bauldia sp.]
MNRAINRAASLLLALAVLTPSAPALAQYGGDPGYAAPRQSTPPRQSTTPQRYYTPARYLSPRQIVLRLQAAGWTRVRAVVLQRGGYYTALADRYRYTFAPSNRYRYTYALVVSARTGAVIRSRALSGRS